MNNRLFWSVVYAHLFTLICICVGLSISNCYSRHMSRIERVEDRSFDAVQSVKLIQDRHNRLQHRIGTLEARLYWMTQRQDEPGPAPEPYPD